MILWRSWLPSPGKDSCRRAVNSWVTWVELRGPILSAQAGHQLSIYCIKERAVRQKFSTAGVSEISVQNIRDSGELLSKDRCKTTSGFFEISLLSQLWEEKNYCERRNELSSWRPVFLPSRHILFKLGYDVHALLSSVMYILSGENITAVYTISQRRWDQNTTQVANRLDRTRATYIRLLYLTPWYPQSINSDKHLPHSPFTCQFF